ncbi:ABC transporter substrate-binding protein [Lentzea tibetensis]|uniref:ABC transporter substrate-binding protein n=1 Tax=Lentzea tibetensis TaxID=2591470 RepID=A0A563EL44_9PSEU|nr:ABC transporter substrate-binding protein [Lentzea tibetensis]TWP46987.1 ABC transporter substrate-binding protein [Lentzea tibetensis]
MRCRTALVALVAAVLIAGCGSRLTDEQRAALAAPRGAGAEAQPGTPVEDGAAPGLDGVPGSTGAANPTGPAGQAPPGSIASGCTGTGGATDKGVTAGDITIANISDVSGPVPGLFQSAQQATKAFVEYFNATQGAICGRKLKLVSYDSRTDSGGDQQATAQACEQAFALVGSMSAFDQGGGPAAAGCGIPDLRASSVTAQRQRTAVSFGVASNQVNLVSSAGPDLVKASYPDTVGKAAFLYLNADASAQNARSMQKAAEQRGFTFVYTQAIDIADVNYAPYVAQLKEKGARVVYWIGSAQYAVRLQQAMRQQGYTPDAFVTDPTAYDPQYVRQGGAAVDGTVVFTNATLFEEANAQQKLYRDWLARVAPGAAPSYFGMFAWAAAALFVKTAVKVGPQLTRKAMLDALRGVHDYTADGLVAPQDVGGKRTSACMALVRLKGGTWSRLGPASGFSCGSLIDTGVGG